MAGPVRGTPLTAVTSTEVEVAQWLDRVREARAAGFEVFDWMSAVDEQTSGVALVVQLIAPGAPARVLRLRAVVPPDAAIDSLTSVFAGAAWHEREAREMFGVEFLRFADGSGADLRPLLLVGSAPATPMRKDQVLSARRETPWPGAFDPTADRTRRRHLPLGVPLDSAGEPS